MNQAPPMEPTLALTGWQFFGADKGQITARLVGQKLTTLDKVWLNGKPCTPPDPLNDTTLNVTCPESALPTWEFLGMTGETDKSKRKSSAFPVQNPHLISITSYTVVAGSLQYDADRHPISVGVRLIGVGFTPLVKLAGYPPMDPARFLLSYISPTELLCEIRNPKVGDAIRVEIPGTGQSAAIIVPMPPDKEPDNDGDELKDETGQTTVTTVHSEKTVVKK